MPRLGRSGLAGPLRLAGSAPAGSSSLAVGRSCGSQLGSTSVPRPSLRSIADRGSGRIADPSTSRPLPSRSRTPSSSMTARPTSSPARTGPIASASGERRPRPTTRPVHHRRGNREDKAPSRNQRKKIPARISAQCGVIASATDSQPPGAKTRRPPPPLERPASQRRMAAPKNLVCPPHPSRSAS